MLKSMTGFGRAELVIDDQYEVKIQIRSVNHRYADFSIKAPRMYNFIEEFVRAKLAKCISRGKVEVYVTINKISFDDKQVRLNQELTKSYIENLRSLSAYDIVDDISMSTLAGFSDIFEIEYKEIDEDAISSMIDSVLSMALENFISMRTNEGKRLTESILNHLDALSDKVSLVEERSPQSIIEYRQRLETKLKDTLSTLDINSDESRIMTEVAIFSDKVAVDEETVRLRSHIKEFKKTMQADEAIGKKLDFIIQEMNRETNTIGSKANDINLSKIVVDMKSIIEKIREQIQNIE